MNTDPICPPHQLKASGCGCLLLLASYGVMALITAAFYNIFFA